MVDPSKEPVIGIDLGTTYSCVGTWLDGVVKIVPNEQGNNTTPSYVAFNEKVRLIGEAAKNQIVRNPPNTVFDAKRLIGRKLSDPIVQQDVKLWPFKVQAGDQDKPMICVKFKGESKSFHPEEISSMVLQQLKRQAEEFIKRNVRKCVITVPAYFNDAQRQATKDAGEIAGLDVIRMINEPTAAAMAYGIVKAQDDTQNVLVFDLGGGTFDVSLVQINKQSFKVRAVSGDTHLGGEDFDNRLVEFCLKTFKDEKDINVGDHPRALRRLRTQCEKAKRILSNAPAVEIECDALAEGEDFNYEMTRAKFEDLIRADLDKITPCLDTVLDDAKLTKQQIDEIVMVGGSTRIPRVQQIVKEYFGKDMLNKQVNADEAIAVGATVLAFVQGAEDELDIQKKPEPQKKQEDFVPPHITWEQPKLGNQEQQQNNDQQQQQYGGYEIGAKVKYVKLYDVTPHSLGQQVQGGLMEVMIPRNTQVPHKFTQKFATAMDNQTMMITRIYEGERSNVADNNLLGEFKMTGIAPKPKGKIQFEDTFELDENGILTVTSVSCDSGKMEQLTIASDKMRLEQETIDRLRMEARKYEREDIQHIMRVTGKNRMMDLMNRIQNGMNNSQNPGQLAQLSASIEQYLAEGWADDTGDQVKAKCNHYTQQFSSLM